MDRCKILLVDDEESVRMFLPAVLETSVVRVETVATVDEALTWLDNGWADLVITDLRLEGAGDKSGLEVVARAKQSRPAPVVVVLSAFATREVEDEAKLLGADFFWSKSMPMEELISRVRSIGIPAGRG